MSQHNKEPDFDITRARRDTRACESLIHLNNAGASLMPTPVCEAYHQFLDWEESVGGYEIEAREADALDRVYTAAAELINCQPSELAYTESATRAWQLALSAFPFQRGDKLITVVAEYGSNMIAYIQLAEQLGVQVLIAPNDALGQVDLQALQGLIDSRVKLIAMTHIPTGGGLVNPAAAVGRVAKAAGIPFFLDTCQSVGQLAVDVDAIGCDALCITGRKYLRGPRGTGLLYVRDSLLSSLKPTSLDQHSATLLSSDSYQIQAGARRFELWESNCAAKYALGVAVDYALSWGSEAIERRVLLLAQYLRDKLNAIDGIELTDQGEKQCGIVTFRARQVEPTPLKNSLRELGINVSTSKGSGSLLSFQERGIEEVVRSSVHYYNTESELDYFVDTLQRLLRAA